MRFRNGRRSCRIRGNLGDAGLAEGATRKRRLKPGIIDSRPRPPLSSTAPRARRDRSPPRLRTIGLASLSYWSVRRGSQRRPRFASLDRRMPFAKVPERVGAPWRRFRRQRARRQPATIATGCRRPANPAPRAMCAGSTVTTRRNRDVMRVRPFIRSPSTCR